MAEEGHTLKRIRDALLVEATGFRNYLERNPAFKNRLALARQEGLEELADSLQDIADEIPDVLKARLKSENLRWILSKRKPLVYGDRLDVNVNQTIDIRSALSEAKQRANLAQQTKQVEDATIEAEHRMITDTYTTVTTDSESVDDILK